MYPSAFVFAAITALASFAAATPPACLLAAVMYALHHDNTFNVLLTSTGNSPTRPIRRPSAAPSSHKWLVISPQSALAMPFRLLLPSTPRLARLLKMSISVCYLKDCEAKFANKTDNGASNIISISIKHSNRIFASCCHRCCHRCYRYWL
jgi:hypothetical protein